MGKKSLGRRAPEGVNDKRLREDRSGFQSAPFTQAEAEQAGLAFTRRILDTNFAYQQTEAIAFISLELSHYTRDRHPRWSNEWTPKGDKWRMELEMGSLWEALWELFAWDTAGVWWRRCPHCQKLFYPKRKDQFYCTPRQQALGSKRMYAARKRAQEKKKRVSKKDSRKRKAKPKIEKEN